jgi:hypothetical protein
MYQIIIATPLGELGTIHFTEERKSMIETEILKEIGNITNYLKFQLEDGQDLYMTKGMIDSSVFLLKQVS